MTDVAAENGVNRVLIVDDDPVIRIVFAEALAAIGIATDEAESGEEAIAAIGRRVPDLVLLDFAMPGMDGFETCRAMRKLAVSCKVPVLIATGYREIVEEAFQAGATDFIHKPVDPELLQHRVRFLIRAQATLAKLSESEQRLANAQRQTRMGSWEWTAGDEAMIWSEGIYRLFDMQQRPGASTYEAFLHAAHPHDRGALEKAMREALSESRPLSLEHRIALPSGTEHIVHQQGEVLRGEDGSPDRISGTMHDITERRQAEDHIRHLAFYDSLTALPNRRMLADHLKRLLNRTKDTDEKIALLFLDLDRFKRINDTLGHAAGDALLRTVAERLMTCVRTTDTVGRPQDEGAVSRFGGDEFTMVLPGLRSSAEAGIVAHRILKALRAPMVLEGKRLCVTSSIGIVFCPEDGSDADTLLRNADAAMYLAKENGGDTFQFYSESLNRRAVRRLNLETALRGALENDELALHYQPQIDSRSGKIFGVEALLRWQSPDLGLVAPGEFIPLAEESDLILSLGEWVLRTACEQQRLWQAGGLGEVRMAVNVSSRQIRKSGFAESVERVLRDTGLDPSTLELEITESAFLGDEHNAVETLLQLRSMGLRLALDDFGTGYSSLSHLTRLPIDTLKIDGSFVAQMGEDTQANDVVAAVIAMANRLRLTVIAEGVETAAQEESLREEGCHLVQGFLHSHPVEAAAAEELLRRSRAR
jgi:diguanylate cyclase (GGDEF)-like protein